LYDTSNKKQRACELLLARPLLDLFSSVGMNF